MTVVLQSVHFDRDRPELLNILQRNLPALSHADRFEWLYHRNPAGPSWSWFAYDRETRQVVGVASLFSRAMWIGGEIKLCGQVGDFAIHQTHRSLGPAVLLQRATFAPVDEGLLAFCYDCPPHEAGMSTFRRLGLQANCSMDRYTLPLRTERFVKKSLGSGVWTTTLSSVGNFALRLLTPKRPDLEEVEVTSFEGRFEDEFSRLDEQMTKEGVIRGRRSSEDLNWRYRDAPLSRYRVLTARKAGNLLGYAVFTADREDASLVDVFTPGNPQVALALIGGVTQQCRKERFQTLQAFVSQGNPLTAILRSVGFRYRSAAARVVAYAKLGGSVSAVLNSRPTWSFNQAEILG